MPIICNCYYTLNVDYRGSFKFIWILASTDRMRSKKEEEGKVGSVEKVIIVKNFE